MKEKIIIADENISIRAELKVALLKAGYQVVAEATDGNQAIQMINEHMPQVVITDLILSGVDGFAVMQHIKQSSPDTKIVVYTALTQDGFINKAINEGASYYVVKPFDHNMLVQRINLMLDKTMDSNKIYTSEDLMPTMKVRNHALEERISNIFISVGIPAHIKGYQFLREAVKLAIDTPDIVNNITKKLYPSIASKFETSSSKVERAIRHAIEVAWSRGKIENINNLFGIKVYTESEKPTNGEFIALVADKMLIEGA